MTPIEYIKHGYIQDLEKSNLGGETICGWNATIIVSDCHRYINTAYFIAMIAELSRLKVFLKRYFADYSLNVPISPNPHTICCHGGIFDESSMLRYFEREISDRQYLPANRLLSEFRALLVNEYVANLSMKPTGTFDSQYVGEQLFYSTNEVAAAISAGHLEDTESSAYATFLKYADRYNQSVLKARSLIEDRQSAIKDAAKKRRAIKATKNLYNAIRRGDERAVKALLLLDADVNTLTPSGESLLDFAREKGNSEIIGLLKDKP